MRRILWLRSDLGTCPHEVRECCTRLESLWAFVIVQKVVGSEDVWMTFVEVNLLGDELALSAINNELV